LYNKQFNNSALIEIDASSIDPGELPEGFVIVISGQFDLWLIKNLFEADLEYHY
jgi:hypothetical protein